MQEALRDPIWQFVGVVISVAALAIGIVAIRVQLLRRALGYHHSDERPAFYVFNRALEDRLRVTLDGQPVEGLSTFELYIFNYGNAPIVPQDFIEPITITFPESIRVLAFAVSERTPSNLTVALEKVAESFVVAPILLNQGDEFAIQFLTERTRGEIGARPIVQARVAGVSSFRSRTYRPSPRHRVGYYAFRVFWSLPALAIGILAGTLATAIYAWFRR